VILSEQPAEYISAILSNSTMGISATALAVIGKSGSVAAMHEHGLPVLSVSKPWHPIGVEKIETPVGVIEYQQGNFAACMNAKSLPVPPSVASVASEFISSLKTTSSSAHG
jgi:hypothetical protein